MSYDEAIYGEGYAAGEGAGLARGDFNCWNEIIDRDECARIWNVNGQRARVILQTINKKHGSGVCKILGTSWVIRRSDAEKYRPARLGGRTPIDIAQLDGTTIVE